jgi:uncharacterized protein
MKLPPKLLLAYFCATMVQASDIENACFNCPPLDKVADATSFNDASYYADALAAVSNNLSASELKSAITTAISQNQKQLTYSEVWTALTQTDEDPNNTDNVILLYRGLSIPKFSNGSGSQSSNPDNWNREHVWAKSHGFPDSSQAAYTDINHLRPADISVNSSRGNLDFDNSDAPLSEAPLNRIDNDSFEPRDAVKGDVARMIFYMDTRYEGIDSTPDLQVVDRLTSTGEAALGRLCRLLAWNNADPVDATEQRRNNRVYEFQGNRNPYIDHPEWVNMLYSADACSDSTPPGDGDGDTTPPNTDTSTIFINEIHYDNAGSDVDEAIEIAAPADTDLSDLNLVLYNGSNGTMYKTVTLSGVIPDLQAGMGTVSFAISGIQNGSPDGVALVDSANNVLQFISYEGELTATNGPANGTTSTDIGVSEASSTTVGYSLQLSGAGSKAEDFTWQNAANNTFAEVNIAQTFVSSGDNGGDPVATIGRCNDDANLISAVQGDGNESPVVDQQQIIEGVVSTVFSSLNGFFVQEEQADNDSNSATSEAIFVYNDKNTITPNTGEVVRVIGKVSERYGRTQLSASEDILQCGTDTVAATDIPLPYTSLDDLEALEGMLVSNADNLTVSDNYELGHYGEVVLSNGRLFKATNLFAPNSSDAISLTASNKLNKITLDDVISGSNPSNVIYPTGGLSANNTLRNGDQVTTLTGIMDFSYNKYRVLPTTAPTFVASNPRTDQPDLIAGNVRVASLNVLNLFNGDGNGDGFPTARGADTLDEYQRQIAKTIAALVAINADVVGLMEIENDGVDSTSTIVDLVTRLNAQLGDNTYAYVNTSGTVGTDAIAVALLYKPSVVTPAFAVKINTNEIFNRPPLAQIFNLNENNEQFTVVVNHFKSKGGCRNANGADQDQGDGQGCFNARRIAQATELMNWLSTDSELSNEADVLVIGDLNSYAQEDPISQFTSNGFLNLVNQFSGSQAYSFAFGGELGYLDHALASPSLAEKAVDATEWHINADEPRVLDYNLENKTAEQQASFYADNAYRMSDHDPIVVELNLATAVNPNVTVVDVAAVTDLTSHNKAKFNRESNKWQHKIKILQRRIDQSNNRIAHLDPSSDADKIAREQLKIADNNAQIGIYRALMLVIDIVSAENNATSIDVIRQAITDNNIVTRINAMGTKFTQRGNKSIEKALRLEQQATDLFAKGRTESANRKLAHAKAERANATIYYYLAAVVSASI